MFVTNLSAIVPLSRVVGGQSAFCSEPLVGHPPSVDDLREDVFHMFKSAAVLTPFLPRFPLFFHQFDCDITLLAKQPLSKLVIFSSDLLSSFLPLRNVKSSDASRTCYVQRVLLCEPSAAYVHQLFNQQLVSSSQLQVLSFFLESIPTSDDFVSGGE